MDRIAFIMGDTFVYWSSVVLTMAAATAGADAYDSADFAAGYTVGDVFSVCFEELDTAPVEATVSAISPLGAVGSDMSTYTVRFAFTIPEGVWPGMHATLER